MSTTPPFSSSTLLPRFLLQYSLIDNINQRGQLCLEVLQVVAGNGTRHQVGANLNNIVN